MDVKTFNEINKLKDLIEGKTIEDLIVHLFIVNERIEKEQKKIDAYMYKYNVIKYIISDAIKKKQSEETISFDSETETDSETDVESDDDSIKCSDIQLLDVDSDDE